MTRLVTVALTLLALFDCERPATPQDLEQRFVERAASAGMLEVRLADAALSHGAHPSVREFAAHVLTDQTGAHRALLRAAVASDLDVPGDLSAPHQQEYIRLASLRSDDFDQAYLAATIASHEQALADCREEAANFHSEVARWAAAALPRLERRLAAARELAAETSPAVRMSAATPE